jgi:hypothetical protein
MCRTVCNSLQEESKAMCMKLLSAHQPNSDKQITQQRRKENICSTFSCILMIATGIIMKNAYIGFHFALISFGNGKRSRGLLKNLILHWKRVLSSRRLRCIGTIVCEILTAAVAWNMCGTLYFR